MTAGTRIEYRLRLHGAPIFWRTEITDWSPPVRFVDAQLRGPYRTWVHTHTFEPHPEGTLVRDQVDYDVPGGAFIHWLLVRRDLRRIFEYRAARLERIFSSKQSRASGGT
jgi:ligand-binding SRPBCC domain-containing protein